MKKPKVAILLEFGFHEIKKYINNGFAIELSKEFDIVWFAMDKGSKGFHDYLTSTGFPLVYFKEQDFNKQPTSIENYNQIIRRNWIANKSLGGFHNHSRVRTKSFKTSIYGNFLAKSIFEKLTLKNVQKEYNSPVMKEQIQKHSVDMLFLTGYNSCLSKNFAATGIRMNKKVHYLVNSWKDLFVNNFVPFNSFSTIFVWSERMKQDFIYHMPYLGNTNFVISGNPTFDILIGAKTSQNREFYAEKYGLPVNSKWLLYTMMPLGLVIDEIDTIQFVAQELIKKHSGEEYTIIVRKNPTHKVDDFKGLDLLDNLVIADHYCTYDKEKDMIIQSKEGEKEWLDLLQYSTLNLSVPSTVTLEFLALRKPVFNIEFNSLNKIDNRLTQFFEAGFYKPLFDERKVKRCKNISSLLNEIDNAPKTIEIVAKKNKRASSLITEILIKKNYI